MKNLLSYLVCLFLVGCAQSDQELDKSAPIPSHYRIGLNLGEDRAIVDNLLKKERPNFVGCYKSDLKKIEPSERESFRGIVSYFFSIGKKGKAKRISVITSNPDFSYDMRKCIYNVISKVQFPKVLRKEVFVHQKLRLKNF